MKNSKWFVWLALAAGMALPGASTLSAQERFRQEPYRRENVREERLRADIARDEARRGEAMRCGRYREAERISRDIARDREALRHDYRNGWR